ncbi:hypothetical protein PPL_09917 [Heterostelium album PN500]|uniref:Ankyrin repeat protein n=1 Tax=Heterostelium pallidum (strain ATCC 26659 / Pp 5 / PN500) TaxID=670386 RepID=D3BPQ0_HETP5|nr:hypothetical protein PPL_09917 [Heterostelium album PN500]EFA76612.1 hypothetical protein PPL_09917 [Heterostelium album PN500]|eukprot:XP_020428744.1 hypothetical protein PPL_09917 [Heterostelium album PN500]
MYLDNLFRTIFHNVVLRNNIFNLISYIHTNHINFESSSIKAKRYTWDQLSYHPSQLIRYRLIDRFYQSFDREIVPILGTRSLHSYDAPGLTYLLAFITAASCNQLEIVKFLMNQFSRDTRATDLIEPGHYHTAACNAAKNGHLEIIKFFHSDPRSTNNFNEDTMHFAASKGRLEVCQFLHANRKERAGIYAIDWSAESGHYETTKYLLENGYQCSEHAMIHAAKNGHLQLVQLLHSHDAKCTHKAIDLAAKNGHISVITYLHNNRKEGCSLKALEYATNNKHTEVVNYLKESSLLNTS